MGFADMIDWIRGYVVFSVSGMLPERFLNLCARSGPGLSEIKRGSVITAKVPASKYRALHRHARKCRVRLKIREKKGLPFIILPYRRRSGMMLGFPLFFLIIWLLSLFVWEVDIPVISPENSARFSDALYQTGIRPGALRSGIDCTLAEREISLAVTELSWVGISMYGSRVVVDARELESYRPPEHSDAPCNIVASDGGIITLVEPGMGRAEVERGQTVAPGELLISGITELSNGSVIMSRASGRVWARVSYEFTSEIPLVQDVPVRTGRVVEIRRLSLLGLEIPLANGRPEGEAFEREISEWQLNIGETSLPLKIRSENWYELKMEQESISPEQAEEIARAETERRLRAVGAAEMIETSYHTERSAASVTVTLNAVVVKNIAEQREILLSE